MPLGEKIPLGRGHQIKVPPEKFISKRAISATVD